MKNKNILIYSFSVLLIISIIILYKGEKNMKVFNHSKKSYEEILKIEEYQKSDNLEYLQNISNEKKENVQFVFHGINPPENSRINLYSNALSHTIYNGKYQDKIKITIPTSAYEKEYGMDAIKFSIYNYNTGDTYVLEQEKPYIFWKKNTVVNIKFLPKREYYNDEFALFIGYTVILEPTKK